MPLPQGSDWSLMRGAQTDTSIGMFNPADKNNAGKSEQPEQSVSIFSKFDNNKNNTVELADNATKQAVMSGKKEVSKNGIAQEILQQLNFNLGSVFSSKLSSFENYSYEAKGPISQESVDSGAQSHIESQTAKINDAVQAEFDKQVAKAQEALESAKNDSEFQQLESEYNQAKQSFEAHLKQDGVCADIADGVSKIWNNKVGQKLGISTGNTASMVREDFSKFEKLMTDFKKTTDPNKRTQIKQELKSMDIKNRVEKYNQSQEDGAEAVKTTAVVAGATVVTVATGGAGGLVMGAAVGGAMTAGITFADEEVKDYRQNGELNIASSEGRSRMVDNMQEAGIEGAKDFAVGAALGGAGKGVKLAAKSGAGKAMAKGATQLAEKVMPKTTQAVGNAMAKTTQAVGNMTSKTVQYAENAMPRTTLYTKAAASEAFDEFKENLVQGKIEDKTEALRQYQQLKQSIVTTDIPSSELQEIERFIDENFA